MFLAESYYKKGGDCIIKFIRFIEMIILIFLISILLFVLFSKFYLKKDLIKIFETSALLVVTGSMEPTIHIKELIIIQEKENYEINDIVYKILNGG